MLYTVSLLHRLTCTNTFQPPIQESHYQQAPGSRFREAERRGLWRACWQNFTADDVTASLMLGQGQPSQPAVKREECAVAEHTHHSWQSHMGERTSMA